MLKTCSVALLTIAMSVGVAQARHLHMIPACAVGHATAWTCNCSSGKAPVICRRGQWCQPSHVMAEGSRCGW
jgi:hypothetical protein